MSTQTTNYGLVKEGAGEFYNVETVNQNLDGIDAQLKANEEAAAAAQSSASAAQSAAGAAQGTADAAKEKTDHLTVTQAVDLNAMENKLAGVETDATADQTGSEIKTLYEQQADTNAYTDSEKSKLAGIEPGATADQSASEMLTALKTVDGSGSGLDADKVDGHHITVSATEPTSPVEGDIWIDTSV